MELEELLKDVEESVIESVNYLSDDDLNNYKDGSFDYDDLAWEIADTMTPIYYSDLLDLAKDYIQFALDVSGLVDKDKACAIDHITANVFEYLEMYAREKLIEKIEQRLAERGS